MPKESNKFWERCAYGPRYGPKRVPRPIKGQRKVYWIFRERYYKDMDQLWASISDATFNGQLGYYSSYSDDSKVIAVHFAHPEIETEFYAVFDKLNEIGIDVNETNPEIKIAEN